MVPIMLRRRPTGKNPDRVLLCLSHELDPCMRSMKVRCDCDEKENTSWGKFFVWPTLYVCVRGNILTEGREQQEDELMIRCVSVCVSVIRGIRIAIIVPR